MGSHQPIRKIVSPEIPDKLYFRIGDVARLCEMPAYVLRFWETEFPQLKPNKGGTGQRLYRKRDVEMALRIKSLLKDQGYTIPGARQILRDEALARGGPGEAAPFPAGNPAGAGGSVSLAAMAMAGSLASVHASGSGAQSGPVPLGPAAADVVPASKLKALYALREELRALAAELRKPIGAEAVSRAVERAAMRPRLVLEPRPKPQAKAPPAAKPEGPRLHLSQGDLFGLPDTE